MPVNRVGHDKLRGPLHAEHERGSPGDRPDGQDTLIRVVVLVTEPVQPRNLGLSVTNGENEVPRSPGRVVVENADVRDGQRRPHRKVALHTGHPPGHLDGTHGHARSAPRMHRHREPLRSPVVLNDEVLAITREQPQEISVAQRDRRLSSGSALELPKRTTIHPAQARKRHPRTRISDHHKRHTPRTESRTRNPLSSARNGSSGLSV